MGCAEAESADNHFSVSCWVSGLCPVAAKASVLLSLHTATSSPLLSIGGHNDPTRLHHPTPRLHRRC